MAFTEDPTLFLADFGVTATSGAISALGILDMPTQVLAGDMVLSTDYTLTAQTADFGNLLYGAGMTVDGVLYTVREVRATDDGKFCEIALQKVLTDPGVVTDTIIDGGGASTVFAEGNIYDGGGA